MDLSNHLATVVAVVEVVVFCDDIHFHSKKNLVDAGNSVVDHYKWRSLNKLVDQLAVCHRHNDLNQNQVVYGK